MALRRVAVSGAIYTAANVLSAGVPFLLLPILTRVLSPEEYGTVVAFYLLVPIAGALAGLGLHGSVGVRWLDRSRSDAAHHTGTAVLLVLATTTSAAVLSSLLGPASGLALTAGQCALAAVFAGANVLQAMRFVVWQSKERPVQAAILQVTSAVLNMSLSLTAVLLLHAGGAGRIAAATLSAVIVGIGAVVLLWRDGSLGAPRWSDVGDLLRFGAPLLPHTLAAAAMVGLDRLVVARQLGDGALGVYGTASQLGAVLVVLTDAGTKAYTPTLYKLLGRRTATDRLKVVAVAYIAMFGWLVVALALWIAFRIVAPSLLGSEYESAALLSGWFLFGAAVGGAYLQIAGLFFFTGKTAWIGVSAISGLAVSAVVVGPLVERFGANGGGGTFLLAQLGVLVAAWMLSHRVLKMPWNRPILALRLLKHRSSRGQ